MKFFSKIKDKLPSLKSSLLATASAVLLVFAFPNFELWFVAWFALVPLFIAIESEKESIIKSFITGWIFGTLFFFGSCWWLTFAPITYAKIPAAVAYLLLFGATSVAGLFPALFGGVFSLCLKRFGHWGILSAPFIWTATEFLRLWTTGNNWNAIGYSQAFTGFLLNYASLGGVFLVSFVVLAFNSYLVLVCSRITQEDNDTSKIVYWKSEVSSFIVMFFLLLFPLALQPSYKNNNGTTKVIAIQPNVPMSGLNQSKWKALRQRQIYLAEKTLKELEDKDQDITVILPESPMNFQYEEDAEFRNYINDFTERNNVSILFNSAEPDKANNSYYNSAVLVNQKGVEVSQYDKIYLLPFGEKVPLPDSIAWIVPTMVGRFSSGLEYDLLPFGDAKAGVMICFESHFPSLSREYARNGADVLIEMTNDGYLGNTPVLRQHLASAVFRAVETNRPVLRVTNVGTTAYVNERGEVLDEAPVYTEATKVWSVAKSDDEQTFYVKYGEWFAWLCSIVSLGLLVLCFKKNLTQGHKEAKTQS